MQARPTIRLGYCKRILLFVCGILMGALPGWGQPIAQQLAERWQRYAALPDDSLHRSIQTLFEIRQCYKLLAKPQAEDSVSELLLERARLNGAEGLIIAVYDQWFTSLGAYGEQPLPFRDSMRVAGYARTMMSIARSSGRPDWLDKAWAAAGRCAMARGDFQAASEAMNKAYYNASLSEDDTSRVGYMLLMGYCQYKRNAKLEAFRHYMDALYLAKKLGHAHLSIQCYEKLFHFYDAIGNHDKAETYLYKIFPLVVVQRPVDSTLLMTHYNNLALQQLALKQYPQAVVTGRKIIDYSLRTGNQFLKRRIFMLLKSVLTENNQFGLLADLYLRQYPEEFELVRTRDPISYYQLMAALCEYRRAKDSSIYYYQQARHAIIDAGRPPNILAFFYRRYGQALQRFQQLDQAVYLLDTALRNSEQIQYLPYMAELSGSLDTLYARLGNMPLAYQYAKLNKNYGEALSRANRQDEVLMLDLENEIRSRELYASLEEARRERRHNIQYMAITLLIGLTFLVLTLLGSFKVPQWAITAIGFFAFIFLFEFIILLIDHKLHELTHGEPWKILGIKIVIIAGMMPFHHWLEHKVVHYLHHHRFIDPSRISIAALLQKARTMMKPLAPATVKQKKIGKKQAETPADGV